MDFKTGSTVFVKKNVNSVYAGDTGIVLETVILLTENPIQEYAVHVAFDDGRLRVWFHEDALESI